jgi:hypothetical protein
MLRPSVLLRSLVVLLVGACETGYYVAEEGCQLILGMDTESLQTCAGIPTAVLLQKSNASTPAVRRSPSRSSTVASGSAAAGRIVTPSSVSSAARSSGSTTLATTTK